MPNSFIEYCILCMNVLGEHSSSIVVVAVENYNIVAMALYIRLSIGIAV